MNDKVLVTGAAGFIGFHLSKVLLEQNNEVIGFDNLNDYYSITLKEARLEILQSFDKFHFMKGDLSEKQDIERAFTEYRPDVVINLAAQAGVRYSIEHPNDYIQSNIVGFANLLECCRHTHVKHLLFASSSSVYGNTTKPPFSVTAKTDEPISLYAATKKADELLAYSYSHLYGIPTTGMRFFTVYGPYGRPDMAYFSFAEKILKHETINVFNNGNLLRDFTYIADVVEGIMLLIEKSSVLKKNVVEGPRYKIYNIGNNHPEKVMDFIYILEDCLQQKAIKEYLPMQAGDVYQTCADISDLERDTGFKPSTSLREGLKRFVEWYQGFCSK